MGVHAKLRHSALPLAAALVVGLVVAVPGASSTAQTAPPSFSKAFSPSTIGPGSTTTLRFTIDGSNSGPATGLAFTDTLPAGVTVASPPRIANGCDGTVSGTAGGTTISLTDGRVGTGACAIAVDVTSSTVGTVTNTTGGLTSSLGNSGTASADLTVSAALPGFTKSFSPNPVPIGSRATLTFTFDNSQNPASLGSLSFIDTLPTGMTVADPNGASTDCQNGFSTTTITAVPGSAAVSFSANGIATPANAPLAAGDTCTFAVDVVPSQSGTAVNVSETLNVSPGGLATKATAALDVTSTQPLRLKKEFTADPALPGSTTNLRFTINNNDRSSDATGVTFTDDLDAALAGLTAVGLPTADPCGDGSTLSGTDEIVLTGGVVGPGGAAPST